ncbi:hypothetical protein, partial [Salmonella enterica]|uniref:hypothetical protein n=1 Tax=Salmonella enterica TaxID=28901 RepID=UPI002FCD76DE
TPLLPGNGSFSSNVLAGRDKNQRHYWFHNQGVTRTPLLPGNGSFSSNVLAGRDKNQRHYWFHNQGVT